MFASLAVVGTSWLASAQIQEGGAGKQRIILPLELVASQPATLAVLTAAGHVAPGVKIVLSSGNTVITDESGRAHFLAPPDAGVMFARLLDSDEREAADVMPSNARSDGLQITSVPQLASVSNQFTVRGSGFQGDADRNRTDINGEACLVLASSPAELILMPPAGISPGLAKFGISEGAARAMADLTLVQIIQENPARSMQLDKKTQVILRVLGTGDPVGLQVQNLAPQIVQFQHGDEAEVYTTGGPNNSGRFKVKAISIGNFSFDVSLQAQRGNQDVPAARGFLEASQKIAPSAALKLIQRAVKNLRQERINMAKARKDFEKISPSADSEDFQALIRAARRALEWD